MREWHSLPEAAKEAALEWRERSAAGAMDDADYDAFADWIAADATNAAAYRLAEVFADSLLAVRRADHSSLDRLLDVPSTAPAARQLGRRPFIAAASLLMLIAVGVIAIGNRSPHDGPVIYASASETETFTLKDGTAVTLAPGSRMEATFAANSRRIANFEGVGFFHVAPDKARPFKIAFGDRTITVVGTKFEVQNFNAHRAVSVAQGVVEVGDVDGVADSPVRLVAGKRLKVDEATGANLLADIDPSAVASWRSGVLEIADETIFKIVERLNGLYGPRAFAVADSETGDTRFSGILQISDKETVARRLDEILPVAVSTGKDGEYLITRQDG